MGEGEGSGVGEGGKVTLDEAIVVGESKGIGVNEEEVLPWYIRTPTSARSPIPITHRAMKRNSMCWRSVFSPQCRFCEKRDVFMPDESFPSLSDAYLSVIRLSMFAMKNEHNYLHSPGKSIK